LDVEVKPVEAPKTSENRKGRQLGPTNAKVLKHYIP